MAHEMMHAYDYLNHFRPVTKDKRDKGEDRAVSFRNYICNEYNDDSNVDNYGLRKNGNFNMYYSLVELILQNIYNEKVAHIADI